MHRGREDWSTARALLIPTDDPADKVDPGVHCTEILIPQSNDLVRALPPGTQVMIFGSVVIIGMGGCRASGRRRGSDVSRCAVG
jgi:hypothetical protein